MVARPVNVDNPIIMYVVLKIVYGVWGNVCVFDCYWYFIVQENTMLLIYDENKCEQKQKWFHKHHTLL